MYLWIAYNEVGNLQYQRGLLNEAVKSYNRTRDYCTMTKHTTEMCINNIIVIY